MVDNTDLSAVLQTDRQQQGMFPRGGYNEIDP